MDLITIVAFEYHFDLGHGGFPKFIDVWDSQSPSHSPGHVGSSFCGSGGATVVEQGPQAGATFTSVAPPQQPTTLVERERKPLSCSPPFTEQPHHEGSSFLTPASFLFFKKT